MTQYDIENAAHQVDGYLIPHPLESEETAFARAKAETLTNLKKRVAHVEALTLAQFKSQKKR